MNYKDCDECTSRIHGELCDRNKISACALDLINRLKAKNKELEQMIVTQRGLIDYQKAEIERLGKKLDLANICIDEEVVMIMQKKPLKNTIEH